MLTHKHAIEEYLRQGGRGVLYVSREARKADALISLAREQGVEVRFVSPSKIKRLAPRGGSWALEEAEAETLRPDLEEWLRGPGSEAALVVVLDHVTDPHNVGAVLRSCEQFGVDLVVIPARRAAGLGGVVADTSAGAVQHVAVSTVTNLANAISSLQEAGFWCYAAEMSGDASWSVEFPVRTVLILGSEGKGVSALLRKRSDGMVGIPRYGKIDSLNVSVAAGVLLYEYRRQHR